MTMETFTDVRSISIAKSKAEYCEKEKCHGDCVIDEKKRKNKLYGGIMLKKKQNSKLKIIPLGGLRTDWNEYYCL